MIGGAALLLLVASCGKDDDTSDLTSNFIESNGQRFSIPNAYILDLSPRGNTTRRTRFLYLTDGDWDTEEERVINHKNLINVQLTVKDGDFLTEGTYEVIGNIGDNQEFYWLNWHVNLDDGEIGSIMDDGTLDIRLQNDLLFVDFTAKEFRGENDFTVTGTYKGIVEVYLSN